MPETPVLTKNQQKSSLSGKKTKTKYTIRNVLATPYVKFWPHISPEHTDLLRESLTKHLPAIVPEKVNIPWKLVKDVPRSERKTFRQQYLQQQSSGDAKITNKESEGLIFGVNDATKAIETGKIRSVLITSEVHPKLMVEHLIDQSVLLRIPVLIVPELKSILKSKCGISSICIGFTDHAKYGVIDDAIQNIFKHYPVPRNHINFQRSLDLLDSSVIAIEDSITEINDSPDKDVEENPEAADVYLYRTAKTPRMFTPEKSDNEVKNNSLFQVDSSGFLAFSAAAPKIKMAQVKKKYKSLKVMRLKGDVNRNNRKIEAMKRKGKGKNCKAKNK